MTREHNHGKSGPEWNGELPLTRLSQVKKFGLEVLCDIAVELQFAPETWRDDAEGNRLRYYVLNIIRFIVSLGKVFAEVHCFYENMKIGY